MSQAKDSERERQYTDWLRGAAKLGKSLTTLALLGSAAVGAQAATITRTSAFEYDSATGILNKEIIEPADSSLCVVTTYTLDAYGNRTGATTRNCNGSSSEAAAPATGNKAIFSSRTVSTSYSSDGRFPLSNTNALGQAENKTYDAALGVLTSLTGPNGLSTYWAYDALGRKVLEKRADGNGTRWKYEYCSTVTINGAAGTATCPTIAGAVGAYVLTNTPVKAPIDISAKTDGGANGAYSKVYYDALGRVIRTETQGADLSGTSTLISQDSEYNALGQVSRQSKPYYAGAASIQWASNTYDLLGRVTKTTAPDGSKTTTTFAGLTVTVTNDKGQQTKQTSNVAGQAVTITDANNKTLSKTWDANGNLRTTTDALGNVVTLGYDLKGRKTSMQDPDMGSWSYVYNALGELVQQTDAKAQVTTMAYDLLGRMTNKVEPTQTSTWYYDKYQSDASWQTSTCAKGIGKLCQVVTGNGYGRKHTYDSLGRPLSSISTIGSAYTVSTSYNSDGRAETLTYPGSSLKLKNVYTALGYLKQVINADAPSSVYWKAEVMDAEGHLTQQTTGNLITTLNTFDPQTGSLKTTKAGASGSGTYAVQNVSYNYDTLGNLTSTSDSAAGASATYSYDNLNRLTSEARLGAAVTTTTNITWGYNEIGNMTSRSDVGTYNYPAGGASTVRPHAVTGVVGTVNGVANPSYGYDANGNLTSATGRTVSWTSFNKVQSITRTVGSTANTLAYVYDAEGERVKETYTQNGTVQRTTIYLNPGAGAGLFYEEEITPAGTKKKHYINAAGGTIGVLTLNTATSAWTTQYWHKDHLGSTVVVTDQVGAVTERMSYEPYGKRRNVNGSTDLLATLAIVTTRRGFTGHEMMDEVGLVNMNGRIYDPAISRFLSADPYIQAPGNLQSYNRYSYVMNSPFGGVDPSGYLHLRLKDIDGRGVHEKINKAGMKLTFDVVRQMPGQNQVDKFIMKNPWAYQIGMAVASYYGGAIGAAAWSSYYAYYSTGSINTAYRVGQTAFATAMAMNVVGTVLPADSMPFLNAMGHAAVGCASAAATGGECGQGAAGGFAGALATNYGGAFGKTIPGAMLAGGLGSAAAGGDFASGAGMAAMGYLFNHCMHAADCWADAQRQFTSAMKSVFVDPLVSVANWVVSNPGETALTVASVTPVGSVARGVQIGGRAVEIASGVVTESQFLRNAINYLGKGYTEAANGRWVSIDGLRQVRFGAHEVRDVNNLHGHFEAYDRAGGRVIENAAVKIVRD